MHYYYNEFLILCDAHNVYIYLRKLSKEYPSKIVVSKN